MLSTLTQEAVGTRFPASSINTPMCLCIDSEEISSRLLRRVRLVLEVSGLLGRGETTCARRQKAYTRSVKEGDARGDPEIEAEWEGKTLRLKNGGHADFEGASAGAVGMQAEATTARQQWKV